MRSRRYSLSLWNLKHKRTLPSYPTVVDEMVIQMSCAPYSAVIPPSNPTVLLTYTRAANPTFSMVRQVVATGLDQASTPSGRRLCGDYTHCVPSRAGVGGASLLHFPSRWQH